MRITKTGPATAAPGEPITWQLTVANAGPSVAQAVVVTDELPAGAASARGPSSAARRARSPPASVRCELGAVPVSDGTAATSRVVTVTATIDPASTLGVDHQHRRRSPSSTTDPDPTNNSASVDDHADAERRRVDHQGDRRGDDRARHERPRGRSSSPTPARRWPARSASPTPCPPGVTVQSAQLTVGATTTPCTVAGAVGDLRDRRPGARHAGAHPPRRRWSTRAVAATTAEQHRHGHRRRRPTRRPTTTVARRHAGRAVGRRAHHARPSTCPAARRSPAARSASSIDVTNNGPSAAQAVVVDDVLPADDRSGDGHRHAGRRARTRRRRAPIQLPARRARRRWATRRRSSSTARSLSDATEVTNTADGRQRRPPTRCWQQLVDGHGRQRPARRPVASPRPGPPRCSPASASTWTITAANNGPSDRRRTSSSPTRAGRRHRRPGRSRPAARHLHDDADGHLHARRPARRRRRPSCVTGRRRWCPPARTSPRSPTRRQVDVDDARPERRRTTTTRSPPRSARGAARGHQVGRPGAVRARPRRRRTRSSSTNAGPSDAEATLAADTLDPILTPSGAAVPSQGTCTYTSAVLNCALGVVAAGGSVTVRIPVHVDPATTVTDADATRRPCRRPRRRRRARRRHTATVISASSPLADLTLTKTGPAEVVAGTPISWSLGVSNAGPSVAARRRRHRHAAAGPRRR